MSDKNINNFYNKVFEKHAPGTFFVRWCWPAFFLGPVWMAYRRMLLPAILVKFLIAVITFYKHYTDISQTDFITDDGQALSFSASFLSITITPQTLVIFLLIGLLGTYLYGRRVKNKKIENINKDKSVFSAIILIIFSFIIDLSSAGFLGIHALKTQTSQKVLSQSGEKTVVQSFNDVKVAIEKLEDKEGSFVVLHRNAKEFIQTHVCTIELPEKYYHIEYHLAGEDQLHVTDGCIIQKGAISLFQDFFESSPEFTKRPVKWKNVKFSDLTDTTSEEEG